MLLPRRIDVRQKVGLRDHARSIIARSVSLFQQTPHSASNATAALRAMRATDPDQREQECALQGVQRTVASAAEGLVSKSALGLHCLAITRAVSSQRFLER